MHKLGIIVVLGGLAVACGGSSSKNSDSGTAAGSDALGGCNAPACVTGFLSSCTPSGTCVAQSDLTSSNVCYSNGVKEIKSTSLTTGIMTVTLKDGSSTCYSMDIAVAQPVAVTFKNSSGSPVATATYDIATQAMTVACTGGQAVALNSSCQAIAAAISAAITGSASCPDGACTP